MQKFTKNVLIYLIGFGLLGAGGLINQNQPNNKIPRIHTSQIERSTKPIAEPKISSSSQPLPSSSSSSASSIAPSSNSSSQSSSAPKPAPAPAKPQNDTQASKADNAGQHRGIHWPDPKNITIKIVTDNLEAVDDFKQAIDAWNKTGVVNLKLVDKNDNADITCNVQNLSGQTVETVNETQETLGQTDFQYKLPENELVSANANIDIDQIKSLPGQSQVFVAEHELGHALGLSHVNESDNSVMVPVNVKTGITDEDVGHLKELYD